MRTVSVIIPTYNYGRFIMEALESVFAQTYRDFEVIVVDDGSTDDTGQRLKSFAPYVHSIYQANAGPASARNSGIECSRGAYLAFLDADDVWLPHRLERQVERLAASPDVGVVYTWWAFMDEVGNPLPQTNEPSHEGDVRDQLLLGSFVTLPMCMVRRVCFENVGVLDPNLRLSEDWDILLRIASAGYKFACVPEVLMHNRVHANSHSRDSIQKLECDCRVLGKAFSALPPRVQTDSLRQRAYSAQIVSAAMGLFCQGELEKGNKLFADGVRLQPQLLDRPGFYFALAFNLLPYGFRTWQELARRLDTVAAMMGEILRGLLDRSDIAEVVAHRRRRAWSNLLLVLAVLYRFSGRWSKALILLGKAFVAYPLTPGIAAFLKVRQLLKNITRRRGYREGALRHL